MASKKYKPGDLVPVDVRITDVGKVPSKYFVHDEVLAALQRVIRSDVVVHNNPVPPGVDAVFKPYSTASAFAQLHVANDDLKFQLRKAVPGLIFLCVIGIIVILVVWAVWSIVHA